MPPKRSVVWEHFDRKDEDSVLFWLCSKTIKCTNNTSNMRLHLKSIHPTVLFGESSRGVAQEVGSGNTREDEPAVVLPSTSTDKNTIGHSKYRVVEHSQLEPPKKRPRLLKLIT